MDLVTLEGVQKVRYSELVSSMIIVYDYLITLDQEIELIWKTNWSFGKCLFLMNRYYALGATLFNNYVIFGPAVSFFNMTIKDRTGLSKFMYRCVHWFQWQGTTGVIVFMLGELILQLRLFALYNLNKRILSVMLTTFVAAVAASTVVLGIVLSKFQVSTVMAQGSSRCTILNLPSIPYFYSFWIPMMLSDSLLCALVIYQAARNYISARRSASTFTFMESGRQLVNVLIRDSMLYFLVLFIVYLCNTIVFLQHSAIDLEAAVAYAVSMTCVMGSRLCLNVRGMISQDLSDHGSGQHSYAIHVSPTTASPRSPGVGSRPRSVIVFARYEGSQEQTEEYEMHDLSDGLVPCPC